MEDHQLPDDSVDQHGDPVVYSLIGGEVDDVVHEGHPVEAKDVRCSAQCLAQDKIDGGFSRGNKEEAVAVTIVVSPARTVFEGGCLGGVVQVAVGKHSVLVDEAGTGESERNVETLKNKILSHTKQDLN